MLRNTMWIQSKHVSNLNQHFAGEYDDECSFLKSFSDSESESEATECEGGIYQYGPSYFSALAEDDITIGTSQTDNSVNTYRTDFSEFSEFTEQTGMTDFTDTGSTTTGMSSTVTGKSTLTGLSRRSKRKSELARKIAQEMKSLSMEELKMLVKSGKMMKHTPELETLAEEDSLTDDDNPSVVESSYSAESKVNLTKSTEEISMSEYNSSSIEESLYSSYNQVSSRTFSEDQDESQSYSDEPTVSDSSSYSEMQSSSYTDVHEYNGFLSLFKFKAPPRRSRVSKVRESYSDEYDDCTVSSESDSGSYSISSYTEEESNCDNNIGNSESAKSHDSVSYVSSSGLKSNDELFLAASSDESSECTNTRKERDRYDIQVELDSFKFTGFEEDAIVTPRHCNIDDKDKSFQKEYKFQKSFESWCKDKSVQNIIDVEDMSNNTHRSKVVEKCFVEPSGNIRLELGILSKKPLTRDSNSVFTRSTKSSFSNQSGSVCVQSLASDSYSNSNRTNYSIISKAAERVKDPVEQFRNLRSDSGLSYEGDDSIVYSYDQDHCESQDESVSMEDIIQLFREKKLVMEKPREDIHSDDDLDYDSDKDLLSKRMTTILENYKMESAATNEDKKSKDSVSCLHTRSIDLIGMNDILNQSEERYKKESRASEIYPDLIGVKHTGSLEKEHKYHPLSRKNSESSKVSDSILKSASSVDLLGLKDMVSSIPDGVSPKLGTNLSLDGISLKDFKAQTMTMRKNDSIVDSVKSSTSSIDLIGLKDLKKHVKDKELSNEVHYDSIHVNDFLPMETVRHETVDESNIQGDASENLNVEEDDDDIYGINHLVQLIKGQKVG